MTASDRDIHNRSIQSGLVTAVQTYALEHYNDGGWDVVYETYTDAEIAEAIGRATTLRGALAKFKPLVSIWAERQAWAQSFSEEAGE